MNTTKKAVKLIAEICRRKGIRKVVFSPGSRSAPLVIAFSQITEIECLVIPDERVAGYFALGMAQQLRETVAVVCTSGTAVLNLAPAVCEAYYQQLPLLIITADRPVDVIGLGENQAIDQLEVYANFIRHSFVVSEDDDLDWVANAITKAVDATFIPALGPVHVNIHLKEPLYDFSEEDEEIKLPLTGHMSASFTTEEFEQVNDLQEPEKVMLVCGMNEPDAELNAVINQLLVASNIVVVKETTSNIHPTQSISNIDACLDLMKEKHAASFVPGLLITIGKQIVSKKLKQFLKKHPPARHIQIALQSESWNFIPAENYTHIKADPIQVLPLLRPENDSAYLLQWQALADKATVAARGYLNKAEYSDLKVFETLVQSFPEGANIQYGNSTPIRYSNLFEHKNSLTVNSNRGTSGIDGCVSTAAGAAHVNEKLTVCIIGDVSFFYDSNALWNNYLSPDLRIVIVNNSGGNIFRLIDGPNKVNEFEKFFETRHNLSAKHLGAMYGIPYYFCDHQSGLDEILKTFYQPQNGKPAILEIKTDSVLSAAVYKGYFESLK